MSSPIMNCQSRRHSSAPQDWHTASILVALLVCLGACSDNRSLKWSEDVLLPDGRVVTLTRYQEFKGPHELGDTPTESDYWFEFKHPDTGKIVRWESDRDLATLALMIDRQSPILLVTPNFGGAHRQNCPNPPYLLFRHDGATWTEIPIAEIPIKRLHVNMTVWAKDRRDAIRLSDEHLSVDQTQSSKHDARSYIINFGRMTKQTFGNQNCGRTTDDLAD
jgi:hypothetical protein